MNLPNVIKYKYDTVIERKEIPKGSELLNQLQKELEKSIKNDKDQSTSNYKTADK